MGYKKKEWSLFFSQVVKTKSCMGLQQSLTMQVVLAEWRMLASRGSEELNLMIQKDLTTFVSALKVKVTKILHPVLLFKTEK